MSRRWTAAEARLCEQRRRPPECVTVRQLAREYGVTLQAMQHRLHRAGVVDLDKRRGPQIGGGTMAPERIAAARRAVADINAGRVSSWREAYDRHGWPSEAKDPVRVFRVAVQRYCRAAGLPVARVGGRGR